MCSPIACFTQHMVFWRVTQRTLFQKRVQLLVAKTLKFILAIEIVLYEALTFNFSQPTVVLNISLLLMMKNCNCPKQWSCCGYHTRLVIRRTWVQIPLGAITIFPQKLSSVEFPSTFSQFLLNLDCESICDHPGGHSVVGSSDLLICLLTLITFVRL